MRARGNLTIDLCSNTAAGRKAFISHHAPSHLIQLRLMLHSRFLGAIVKDSLFCAKCLLAFNLFRHRNCSNIVELSFRMQQKVHFTSCSEQQIHPKTSLAHFQTIKTHIILDSRGKNRSMKNRNQCGSEDVTNFMVISFDAQTSECQLFFFFFIFTCCVCFYDRDGLVLVKTCLG